MVKLKIENVGPLKIRKDIKKIIGLAKISEDVRRVLPEELSGP